MTDTQNPQPPIDKCTRYCRDDDGKFVPIPEDAVLSVQKAGEVVLPELEGDLVEILGRPNFQCASLANALRLKGQDIPFKSEEEQAAVLYLLLSCYLKDKENWRDLVRDELLDGFVQRNDRMAFGNVQHIGSGCSMISVTVMKREVLDNFPENFNIKGIFKKPYVLEEGIFFNDDAHTAQAIIKYLKAGEVFDTALLPEGWMTYDQFFTKLDEQHKA